MKPIFILYLFVCSVASAQHHYGHDNPDTSLPRLIKLEVFEYKYKGKEVKGMVLRSTHNYYYNSARKMSEMDIIDKKNKESFRSFYYYDSLHRMTKRVGEMLTANSYLSFLEKNTIYEYAYDSLSRLEFVYNYNEPVTKLVTTQYVYDSNNLVSMLRTRINKDTFYTTKEYYYTSDKKILKEEYFDQDQNLLYWFDYVYDTLENTSTLYVENKEGRRKHRDIQYDSAGKVLTIRSVINMLDVDPLKNPTLDKLVENFYNPDGSIDHYITFENNKRKEFYKFYYAKP